MDIERLIVLAPIEPAPTGNGLAMRTQLFCRSVPRGVDVLSVVVPVAGRLFRRLALRGVRIVPSANTEARAGVRALVESGVWRNRLQRAGALPHLARAASPGLADAVLAACEVSGGERIALHVMRSYLAPLGVALAERLPAAWVTLDLDEDDAQYERERDDADEAAAYERLLGVFAPCFDGLCAAAAAEAEAISRRHELAIEPIPNAVRLPRPRPGRADRPEGVAGRDPVSLLFVGNLTYAPNIEAARTLVEEILPRLRRALGDVVRVTLAGRHGHELLALGGEAVELAGYVPNLAPLYASADAVVAPLKTGAGTRIKVLEAFARGVPVVASPAAVAGLEVVDGRQVLVAADSEQAADAIVRVVTEKGLAARLVGEARQLVRDRYSLEVVIPSIQEFFNRAAKRARSRAQLSAPA